MRELAKKVGVSAAFLSDVELGRRYPSEKIFVIMAQTLDTTLEDLRQYDARPPVEDLRRLVSSNPLYGVAFRKVIDKEITPQELIEFAEEKSNKKKKS